MKRFRDIYISELRCIECGAVFPIPRKEHSRRERNHTKDLWCYKCEKVTKFKEN
jgi:hypothetical protein